MKSIIWGIIFSRSFIARASARALKYVRTSVVFERSKACTNIYWLLAQLCPFRF